MTKLLVVLNIILILLVGLVLFNQAKLQAVMVHGLKSQHHYFVKTEDGRLIPMLPLDERKLSDSAVLSWVSQAIIENFSFNNDLSSKNVLNDSLLVVLYVSIIFF